MVTVLVVVTVATVLVVMMIDLNGDSGGDGGRNIVVVEIMTYSNSDGGDEPISVVMC